MVLNTEFKKFIYQAIISYLLVILSSLVCLEIFEVNEKNSFLISIIISFIYNFLFSIKITFKTDINLKNFINYIFFTLIFRTLEYFIFLLIRNNFEQNYFIIVTFVLLVSFLTKFIILKKIYTKK